ncbi:RES domain-containing protein [Pontibacter ummariensis]|uniref:RES domain-containing protein n=1 Tax=Pontibacter ummariensis TaxID=1610492 RepID=A0A239FPA9_9BACT|nr:RES family NAD+ phosphorylase [Pontibacter ummariensis]PRY11977.1 RES domain-containing protein [Pontibacter ummariensis]SNS58856.1 RES domain-containing protein [Pontibacter ummariensis]
MIVYRLSKGRFAKDLSGKGAELAGGRWNSKGVAMLYTSESIALCTVEVAVHMPLGIVPSDYHLVRIQVPNNASLKEIKSTDLPEEWESFPHPNVTQALGDAFILASEFLVLKVPSAAVQGTYNFLLNPRHKDFSKVKVMGTEPFQFDRRLFVKA